MANPAHAVASGLRAALSKVVIRPRRLQLETPGVTATVPMIRGVWGAALYGLDIDVWATVFEGRGARSLKTPGYILRPAPPDPATAPEIEWIAFGPARGYDQVLRRAWDVASGMGLGSARRRFFIKAMLGLNPDLSPTKERDTFPDWTLDRAATALEAHAVVDGPCELVFESPLRLIRGGQLVTRPTLPDIVLGGLRRLRALLHPDARADLHRVWEPTLRSVGRVPARAWRGRRLDLVRWSARQQVEVEVRGVAGSISLPRGAGPLLPLLAALQWIHLGKSTVVGLGQLSIRPGVPRTD